MDYIKRIILFGLLFIMSCGFAAAYTAEMIDTATGQTTSLSFDRGSDSYNDDGLNNPDIKLRVYPESGETLEGKWACLLYKVGDSFVEISDGPAINTRCEQLSEINSSGFYETSNNFMIDDDIGVYPALVYSAVSDDMFIDNSDDFAKIDPETGGWLLGADGGVPCSGNGAIWSYTPSGCNDEPWAEEYDSYDIEAYQQGNNVILKIVAAYYPLSGNSALQSTIDKEYIAAGIRTPGGDVLDSGITSIYDTGHGPDTDDSDDELALNFGDYSGRLDIIVNGIKTDNIDVEPGEPSPPPESEGIRLMREEGAAVFYQNMSTIWTFPIDGESFYEITFYLKKPISQALFNYYILPESYLPEGIAEMIDPETNINQGNIDGIYVEYMINKEWARELSLDKTDLGLIMLVDGKIKTYKGEVVGEDENYFYLTSKIDKLRRMGAGGITAKIIKEMPIIAFEMPRVAFVIKESFILLIIVGLLIVSLIILILRRRKKKD